MERWPRRAKNLPKGWVVESVPMDLFNEWLDTPGLESQIKDSMRKGGVPDDAQVIVVSGEKQFGSMDIWFHPVAAFKFGEWYAEKLSGKSPRPRYGVIYAAIYDNGLTKVGMASTGDGADRLAEHDAIMSLTDASPIEHIVMPCKAKARGAESRLIEEMAARYQQKRREWFLDVDIELVREIMADCIEKDWQERCQSAKVSV